jgi:hypothetical protein
MAASVTEHATHNSVKRNRDATVDIPTSELESEEPQQKKSKAESNNVSPVEVTTKDITDDTTHTSESLNNSSFSDTNTGATAVHSTSSAPDTASEDEDVAAVDIPTASLQGLPRELRIAIFNLVVDTDERIVLGRRMVEARRNNSLWTLDQCFNQAAINPLSMTCRQFQREFQDFHVGVSKSSYCTWILLVNNFDLEQLQVFSDYIQSKAFFDIVGHEECPTAGDCNVEEHEPIYNMEVILRFQMDDRAINSARALCKQVYFDNGKAPASLCDWGAENNWLAAAEIITKYDPRATASLNVRHGMSTGEARCIVSMFSRLRPNIKKMPMYNEEGVGEPFDRNWHMPNSLDYMEQCWFEPFCEAVGSKFEAGWGEERMLWEYNRRYD